MLESYPKFDKKLVDNSEDNQIELLFNLIKDVRNYKIENKLAPNASLDLSLILKIDVFPDFMAYLKRFTFSSINIIKDNSAQKGAESHIYNGAELFIASSINKAEQKERLEKEIANLNNEIKRCQNMLNNPSFLAKAPADKVSLEREKLQKHLDNLAILEEKLANL